MTLHRHSFVQGRIRIDADNNRIEMWEVLQACLKFEQLVLTVRVASAEWRVACYQLLVIAFEAADCQFAKAESRPRIQHQR